MGKAGHWDGLLMSLLCPCHMSHDPHLPYHHSGATESSDCGLKPLTHEPLSILLSGCFSQIVCHMNKMSDMLKREILKKAALKKYYKTEGKGQEGAQTEAQILLRPGM